MGILSWIILGLIVGMLAKWIMPGRDRGESLSHASRIAVLWVGAP